MATMSLPPADQPRSEKIATMQAHVDAGLASGSGNRSKDELFAAALARVHASANGRK